MNGDETKILEVNDFKMSVRLVDHSLPITKKASAQKSSPPKTPLVLIMGYRGHLGWWPEELVMHFAKHQMVILYDHRGAGQSTRGKKSYSLKTLAEDLRDLLDELKIPKAILLGVSMGGMVAMEFGIQFPDRTEKLILANSMRRLKLEKPWRQNFRGLVEIYTKNQRVRKAPLFLNLIFTPDFLKNADDMEWAKILSAFSTRPISPQVAMLQLKSIVRWKKSPAELARITCPTLVLAAERDLLCPPQNSAEIVKDLWDAHFVKIRGLGHAMLYEGLHQVLRVIDPFLRPEVAKA